MFLAWMWLNGLESELVRQELKRELAALRARKKTPGDFLMDALDEKIIAADFSDEGNALIKAYFRNENGDLGQYIDDYSEIFDLAKLASAYHVEDSWENYDKLAKVIDGRYRDWSGAKKKKKRAQRRA